MDLVKIGFQINANGLKDANTEVDKLLDKVDNIGTKGKKASSDFESSQKKVKDSTQKVTKEVDKTSKALEKQKIIGDYLGKGLDKTTATSIASFKQLGGTASQVNTLMTSLASNKGLVQVQKDVARSAKEQEAQAKAVQATIVQYEKLSQSSLGGGILDQIERQNQGLLELRRQYTEEIKAIDDKEAAEEKARQKKFSADQDYYQQQMGLLAKETAAQKAAAQQSIDEAEKARQKKFAASQKEYQHNMELLEKERHKVKQANDERQNAITLEQTKAKYINEGFGKGSSTQLAKMELSGADVTTLDNYKASLLATSSALGSFAGSAKVAKEEKSKFLDQVKGIAIYAALSAAIYGVMTAMTNLAVATVKMADEYTSIQNRMKLYITDAKELGKVNSQLAQFSMENNVGLRETATLFSRLAPSMQKLGANTAAITTVVDAFGKSMRIGGATAMEAASATIQFSQAMASGKLAGDEFRSISEASPRFLKAIAEGSGIAADKLKEMSAAGMLTTQVISKALLKEYPKLIEENKKLGVTMEQGANAIKTGFLVAIGEFNEGAGITKALGEAMLDLAQGMLTGAQNARQFGKDINDWFSANAGTISTVVDAFKLLATVIATRYVASLVLATAASVKLTYQTSALAAATTASMRAFVLGATAATAFGRAAQTAFAFMGGWAGIALTVAGVATSYLLLRDNAAEASKKLVESSEYADMTTNSFKQLNAEQQKNARASLIKSMSDVNEKLDEQANTVNRVLLSYVQLRQMQGKMNNKQLDDVINKTTKGLMDYDTAYRKLLELGAPTNVVEEFKKQKDVYNETAKSAKTLETSANAAGAGVKLAGNEAQNATPAINGLKDKTKQLGEEAVIAGSKFNKMAEDFKKAISDSRDTLNIMQKFDLDEAPARKVVSSVRATFDPLEQKATDLTSKIKTLNKQLSGMSNATPQQRKLMQEHIDSAKESLRITQEQIKLGKDRQAASLAPYAKLAQAEEDRISALTASRKDEDKSLETLLKKREDTLASYQDQVDTVDRIQQLLAKGVGYEVAKVAASKDYYENIRGTMLAEQVILAQQTQKRLEYRAGLSEEEDIQTRLKDLQKEGASYAQARAVSEAGFRADAEGILALQELVSNELYAQHYSLSDQLSWYNSINGMLERGFDLEEATTRAMFSRLESMKKGLTDADKALMNTVITQQKNLKLKETERQVTLTLTNAEKQRVAYVNAQVGGYANLIKNMAIANKMASDPSLSPSQAKELVEAEEKTNYEKELAELKRQTYIATLNESDAVKTLVSNYSTMDSVQIGVLANQQRLLEIAKELSEEAAKQASPSVDLSGVDFSVFGDFGNPFQSALDGMNALIQATMSGGETIKKLNEDIAAAELMGLDTTQKEIDLNLELQKQAKDKKQATDKAIASGLSLTKSLFKEESKGYKVVSGMEKAYQASKIAFALWEKKDEIAKTALSLKNYVLDALGFQTAAATKMATQTALNVTQAQGAVASAAQAPPPIGFASAAAMIALMAGLGIALSGGGSSSGSFATSNTGTGTVFGDPEAQSASIANSIDLLSENSDLMLPLTSAMLRSLRNIESSIGGVTNLILRQETGQGFNITEGFNQNFIGSFLEKAGNSFFAGIGDFLGINKMLGGLLGGLFGSKTTIKGQGLFGGAQSLGNILKDGFNLKEYVDIQVKNKTLGVTTSTKNKTKYASANKELENQFTLIFSGFYDSILSATDILGANNEEVRTKLENAIINIGKINLKGLNGEQIQEKLEAVFGAAADSLAQQGFAGLEDFQTVGEGYYETLIKVATGVEQAKYFTDRLNVTAIKYTDILNKQGNVAAEIVRQSVLLNNSTKDIKGGFYDLVNSFDGTAEELTDFVLTLRDLQDQLFMTGKNADYLTSSMILGAGGLDNLSNGLEAYFEMLSPAEQAAELTRRLTNEFAIFGKELPSDVKAFRNLVSSIDISTEAGQKLYGQILALAPEFNDLQDALESANSDVNALVQSLRDLAEQARAARGETEQPRNLTYLRNEFNRASELALQGDTEAANRLISIGKDLMSMSKLYAVSGSDYARDLAFIQGVASTVADLQESGLGTSISPDLKPSTTTGSTTPTVETVNNSTDARLDALSEKLEAGLFAIAKYTQVTATKLENWDDGNRIMVGVIQETGDPKLNVTVV